MSGFPAARLFIKALAMMVAVALIGAASWVVLHNGIGVGDLSAFLIWVLPFGVIIGCVVLVLRRSPFRVTRGMRVVLTTALGALLGALWALGMAVMMGPWFGTLSFPVLPILAISSALVVTTLGI